MEAEPHDPNSCMNPGKTIQTYQAYGKRCVRPIGKSWKGDPAHPVANTAKPVLVNDELFDDPQHLMADEAELLMGMRANCTDAEGVTIADRLRSIGNGWDINVVSMLLSQSKLCSVPMLPPAENVTVAKLTHQLLVAAHDDMGDEAFAASLSTAPTGNLPWYLSLLASHYQSDQSESVLDSGSARHLQTSTSVLDSENRTSLIGFDGSSKWTEGS